MPLIARGLGHRFPERPWLFRGLDVTLHPGRIYALSGPSGSGKSTLLSILAGWAAPAEGTLERPGVRTVSWVFQNPHGSPRRSAVDHVALPLLARGLSATRADAEARALMREFGIDALAERPFRELSGGEAQRLMFARGRAVQPDLLLVDEPTAQLDPRTADAVNATISALRSGTLIAVVATHHPGTRAACTDTIDLADNAATDPRHTADATDRADR